MSKPESLDKHREQMRRRRDAVSSLREARSPERTLGQAVLHQIAFARHAAAPRFVRRLIASKIAPLVWLGLLYHRLFIRIEAVDDHETIGVIVTVSHRGTPRFRIRAGEKLRRIFVEEIT